MSEKSVSPENDVNSINEEEISDAAAETVEQTAEESSTGQETAAEEEATSPEAEIAEEEVPKTPEEEILMWKEAALRAKADLDNYRKRMTREKADTYKFANQSLLEELLPVLDNFEMGMMAAAQDQESMIFKGMEMVQRQLGEFLTNQGIKEISTAGEYDHNLHEAVAQEESADHEEGAIIRVVRRGFEYQGRLLRPANVVVAAGAAEEEAPQPTEPEADSAE